MNRLYIGDIVGRKSYNCDIMFKVVNIGHTVTGKEVAVLKGVDVRLLADAPTEDLIKASPPEQQSNRLKYDHATKQQLRRSSREHWMEQEKVKERNMNNKLNQYDFFGLSGRVLHLDGDKDYLQRCLTKYKELKVDVVGEAVDEHDQPQVILGMLRRHRPDILVLTGHDGIRKGAKDLDDINSYHNTKYFLEAVRQARLFEKGRDELIIFAGACHSHFSALIRAGANYASSPQRVVIHCYDPVLVAEKLANSSIRTTVPIDQVIGNTLTGISGIGGIETKGKYRLGLPKLVDNGRNESEN